MIPAIVGTLRHHGLRHGVPERDAGFARLLGQVTCPGYALGGVTPENAAVFEGGNGFAVVRGVLAAANPVHAARALLDLGRKMER